MIKVCKEESEFIKIINGPVPVIVDFIATWLVYKSIHFKEI